MALTIQDINKIEDKTNFSPELKKIIKEEEKIQNIVEKIIEKSITSEESGGLKKNWLKKYMTTLIKKNNIDVSKINKESFAFKMSYIYDVLNKLELNKKYSNEIQKLVDSNYTHFINKKTNVPNISTITITINFTDFNNIVSAAKNLNNEGIKINLDKEIEKVTDMVIKNLNITKEKPIWYIFLELVKIKNPERVELLKKMYEKDKRYKQIEENVMFESWIELKLEPMFYSQKQKIGHKKRDGSTTYRIDKNSNIIPKKRGNSTTYWIDINWNEVEYTYMGSKGNNFDDAIFLWYWIRTKSIPTS